MTDRRTLLLILASLAVITGGRTMLSPTELRDQGGDERPVCSDVLLEAIRSGDGAAVAKSLDAEPALARTLTPDGVSVLLFALYNGRVAIAEQLRGPRESLDVFEAAATGDLAELRSWVDRFPGVVDERSADGFTPLHLAAFFGRDRAARILLAAGADVDAGAGAGGVLRPLHSGAASRRAAVVRLLLAAGADPDARQQGGFTALHSAAKHGDLPMAIALLAHGADPTVAAEDGSDALSIARESGDARLEKLVRSSVYR